MTFTLGNMNLHWIINRKKQVVESTFQPTFWSFRKNDHFKLTHLLDCNNLLTCLQRKYATTTTSHIVRFLINTWFYQIAQGGQLYQTFNYKCTYRKWSFSLFNSRMICKKTLFRVLPWRSINGTRLSTAITGMKSGAHSSVACNSSCTSRHRWLHSGNKNRILGSNDAKLNCTGIPPHSRLFIGYELKFPGNAVSCWMDLPAPAKRFRLKESKDFTLDNSVTDSNFYFCLLYTSPSPRDA